MGEETRERQGMEPPNLVDGLKAIPGCLGVETATTGTRKEVLFAWFRDKRAVLDWYYSDLHRHIQDHFFPKRPPRTPLEGVPEDSGPIMTVASLMFPGAASPGGPPFPQISIELYKPITGGIFIGERFRAG